MGTLPITRRHINAQEGFTLFEILLVIAIISTLSTIAFLSFGESDSALELQRVRFSVEQGLENAKLNAFNGLLHHGEHVESFGVHVEKDANSIIIFADCNKDSLYNSDAADSTCGGGNTELVDTILFEGSFSISNVIPCSSGDCTLSIMFKSPFATVSFFTSRSHPATVADITISSSSLSDTIAVNRAGRIIRRT